jgi:hypothetical protein
MANKSFLIIVLAVLVTSCSSYGPKTIERDQMDYGVSIHESIKQQLLGNIVRLRYIEAPMFVNVSSVINQYALSGNVQAGLGFNNSFSSGNTGSIGAGGRWEDRPTVTYSPISGREFSESLLTPIPPEALFALVQSGWPADLMFRLTVASMNGVEDANGGNQADPQFRELLGAWARLRDARVIGLRRSGDAVEPKARIVVYVNKDRMSAATSADLALLREVLELDPTADEYKLDYGLIPDEPDEIAVLTMSILDIMVSLANEIDVPPEHVEEGRTRPTFIDTGLGGPLFRVHVAKDRPDDAYTSVFNRGYWFYIDDRDMFSKRTFGVLQILLSLTDSGDEARGPVVTIGG